MSTMDSAVEGAKDVLRLWQEYEKPNTSGAKTLAFDRYADAAILYGDEISRALLSSQSQVERLREVLASCEGSLQYAYGHVSSVTASKVKDIILPALRTALTPKAEGVEEVEEQVRSEAEPVE